MKIPMPQMTKKGLMGKKNSLNQFYSTMANCPGLQKWVNGATEQKRPCVHSPSGVPQDNSRCPCWQQQLPCPASAMLHNNLSAATMGLGWPAQQYWNTSARKMDKCKWTMINQVFNCKHCVQRRMVSCNLTMDTKSKQTGCEVQFPN